MGYMNHERKILRQEIEKSRTNHPFSSGRNHYEFNVAAERLHQALPNEYDVSAHIDVFKRAYEQMPTPNEVTGVGRAQAAGIERQRKQLYSLMDEVKSQIDGNIGRDDFEGRH